jgi:preprotein translocase subunit YajC
MGFEGIAWAQAGGAAAGGGQQVLFTTVIPLAMLFGIFYFVLIRPQAKKASEQQTLIKSLKKNDEVVTNGGLIGRIVDLQEKTVGLEVAQGVKVRIERAQIAGLSPYGKTAKSGKDD